MAHQKIQVRGYAANLFSCLFSGSTPKKCGSSFGSQFFRLYTKDGASPFNEQFFRQVSDQFPSHFSSTKRAHAGGSFRSCESHTRAAGSTSSTVKTICDAVIPRKTEHSGHLFPSIMQRLAQGAQRRETSFSKLLNFIQQFSYISAARIGTLRPYTRTSTGSCKTYEKSWTLRVNRAFFATLPLALCI